MSEKKRMRGDGNDSHTGTGVAAGLHVDGIGLRLQGITPQQILDDQEWYRGLMLKHKALGFKRLNPTKQEHIDILRALYSGSVQEIVGIDRPLLYDLEGVPEEEIGFGEVMGITHDWIETSNQGVKEDPAQGIGGQTFIDKNWHIDSLAFKDKPAALTSMLMTLHTDLVQNDDTCVASLEYLYEIMPDEFKEKLQNVRLTHCNTGETHTHPALRTHPVTGITSLCFAIETFTDDPNIFLDQHVDRVQKKIDPEGQDGVDRLQVTAAFDADGNIIDMSDIRVWIMKQLKDERLRFTWRWDEGDLFIWDNRCLVHTFNSGFKVGERIFNRVEMGWEAPYYDPTENPQPKQYVKPEPYANTNETGTEEYDVREAPAIEDWATAPASQDHIPLVLTEGIYALPKYKHLVSDVTLFIIVKDEYSNIPDEITNLRERCEDPEFHVVKVPYDENHILIKKYARYWHPGEPVIGQIFLFSRNGDYSTSFTSVNDELMDSHTLWTDILGLLEERRDLRHAGHAWHYPDFMSYPSHMLRPYNWRNLSFEDYTNFDEEGPPKDFLTQFVIDQIFGCFNHYKTNEERKELIEDVRDYLDIMLEMNEHELGR
jgi:alpha-ketoglutarate-dependent taurine dioxygenase